MFSRPWYEIIRERNLLNSIIKLNETIRTRGSSDLILVICAGEISWNISMHSCDRRPSNFEGSSSIIIGRFSCRSENSPLENRGDRKSISWQLVKLSKNLFPRNKKRRNPRRVTLAPRLMNHETLCHDGMYSRIVIFVFVHLDRAAR